MPTIAIAGISSKLALAVAAELLKRSNVSLRGSSRDTSKLPTFLKDSPHVELIQSGPYDKDALRSLVKGSDVVICAYYADNQTMLEGQKLLIDLCEEEGIPRYIASDYTADYTKLEFGDIQVKDPMKHIKAYLETKLVVKGVHVLVGLFMETFWAYFGVWNTATKTLRYWGTGNEPWDLTSYQTAGAYVAAVALDPNAVGVLRLVGEQLRFFDIAENIKLVLEVDVKLEQASTLDELVSTINPSGGEQNPLTAGIYYFTIGKISLGQHLDNTRYPDVDPETFAGFLMRVEGK